MTGVVVLVVVVPTFSMVETSRSFTKICPGAMTEKLGCATGRI
jgi:hypothetical protein